MFLHTMSILIHRPGCCETCDEYRSHLTTAEIDGDKSLELARGKDGMERSWVTRRKYEGLKEDFEERAEKYREGLSTMREQRDQARRLVSEREAEIEELKGRLASRSRDVSQASSAPPAPRAGTKRGPGDWPPLSAPRTTDSAPAGQSLPKRKRIDAPKSDVSLVKPTILTVTAPQTSKLPGTAGGPPLPPSPPPPPPASTDPYVNLPDDEEEDKGFEERERAARGTVGMILAARKEAVDARGEIPRDDPSGIVKLSLRYPGEAALINEYLQTNQDWPMLDFIKGQVSICSGMRKVQLSNVQEYLKTAWRAPPWGPKTKWDGLSQKMVPVVNPAPKPPSNVEIVSRKVAITEGLATTYGPLPEHWGNPGSITTTSHPSLIVAWAAHFVRGELNIPPGLLDDDSRITHAHACGWLCISPLIKGIVDQSILKAIITMIVFQRYPKEVANHNILIAATPSFEPLTLGPDPSSAQTARALADTGLSIEDAADAIEYAQSWIRMCSQRHADPQGAHSLNSFFQAARAIPRTVPPQHIPYAWSEEAGRWRPARTAAAMEVDDSSLPGGNGLPDTAGATATPVENTTGAPAVEKPEGDADMAPPPA